MRAVLGSHTKIKTKVKRLKSLPASSSPVIFFLSHLPAFSTSSFHRLPCKCVSLFLLSICYCPVFCCPLFFLASPQWLHLFSFLLLCLGVCYTERNSWHWQLANGPLWSSRQFWDFIGFHEFHKEKKHSMKEPVQFGGSANVECETCITWSHGKVLLWKLLHYFNNKKKF